jgi:hypothetical protein
MDKNRVVNLIIDYYVRQKNPFGFTTNAGPARCMYKTPEGSMCAIGFLADRNKKLSYLLEATGDSKPMDSCVPVTALGMKVFKYINMERTKENMAFLGVVQDIHDKWAGITEANPKHTFGTPVCYDSSITNSRGKTFIEELRAAADADYSYVNKKD